MADEEACMADENIAIYNHAIIYSISLNTARVSNWTRMIMDYEINKTLDLNWGFMAIKFYYI